jgi:hypothetical protein
MSVPSRMASLARPRSIWLMRGRHGCMDLTVKHPSLASSSLETELFLTRAWSRAGHQTHFTWLLGNLRSLPHRLPYEKEWASLDYGPGLGVSRLPSSKHSKMAIPNRGAELLAVNISFLTTAALAFGLRAFVRIKMVKAFGFDDVLMGSALVSCRFYSIGRS